MTTPDVRLATPMQAAWQQAMGAGAIARAEAPVRPAAGHAPDVAATTASPRSWWARGLRVVRDVAIGFAVVATIPLATIEFLGASTWSVTRTREAVVEVERMRPLAAAVDASISPLMAGEALHRLAPATGSAAFPVRAVTPAVFPWRASALPDGYFGKHRSNWWPGVTPAHAIEAAAAGLSSNEIAWLKQVAEAPLWSDVALVAHAKQVDVYGARLMPSTAQELNALPLPKVQRLREIGEAGVARAAYYVAIKDYARAEQALRDVVSLGFAFIDNGATFVESITGQILVRTGQSGLHQLAAITDRRDLLAASAPSSARTVKARLQPVVERETPAIRDMGNPAMPRSYRFELYALTQYSVCTSVPKTLFGFNGSESLILAEARRTLPRFESERRLLDLMTNRMDLISAQAAPPNGLTGIIVGAAEVVSAVTGNERIASCSRLITNQMTPH